MIVQIPFAQWAGLKGPFWNLWTPKDGLRPVDDPLLGVPLVNMEAGDFLDALPREHENAHGTCVRRVDDCDICPPIGPSKLVLR
jgi:hypothetical protein